MLKKCEKKFEKMMKIDFKIAKKLYFTKSTGRGAKCDHFKLGVRLHLNLDVRGPCVRPKKRSQLSYP